MRFGHLGGATVALAAFLAASPAFAGPPLLCHPFEIGSAASLPWNGTNNWFEGRAGYDVRQVIGDTEALLAPSAPVIVRMETLRRAVLYASQDVSVARALLQRMNERVDAATPGHAKALAYLDAAYVTEAVHEVGMLGQMSEFRERAAALRDLAAAGAGYALIEKSLAVEPADASLHFAAALIAAGTNRQAYTSHATKARAGAGADSLLARNLQHIAS